MVIYIVLCLYSVYSLYHVHSLYNLFDLIDKVMRTQLNLNIYGQCFLKNNHRVNVFHEIHIWINLKKQYACLPFRKRNLTLILSGKFRLSYSFFHLKKKSRSVIPILNVYIPGFSKHVRLNYFIYLYCQLNQICWPLYITHQIFALFIGRILWFSQSRE